MFSTYVTILKNTFRIVKKEPIVLVPYMAFHIIITMAIPYINLTNKLWLFSILEWLIPCLIIQPIVILMAMAIIKNKEIKIDEIFIKCSKCFRALFLASLLYQPWY
ncbi:MAG: hypothetical protein VW397_08600, partial [Candidatus Margulisiibacteriota bacterium]